MIEHDPTYFGCGNKLPANDLKRLLGTTDFGFIAEDSGDVSVEGVIISSTVDTVFPFTSDIELYVYATYYHCANDLLVRGIVPLGATVSLGIGLGLTGAEIKELNTNVLQVMKDNVVTCANIHTFNADQTSLTFSIFGHNSNELTTTEFIPNYGDIYISKPLGNSVVAMDCPSSKKHRDLLQALKIQSIDVFDAIKTTHQIVCTDVSGFGIIGHLLSVAHNYDYKVELLLENVPKVDLFEKSFLQHSFSCSARRNMDSFHDFIKIIHGEVQDSDLELLFAGEINGPILIFVDPRHAENQSICNFLKQSSDSRKIGSFKKNTDADKLIDICGRK
ncbi:MAG: selenide,water dikinase [Psychroserpens sp.]|jgi:selenide,water dikinase